MVRGKIVPAIIVLAVGCSTPNVSPAPTSPTSGSVPRGDAAGDPTFEGDGADETPLRTGSPSGEVPSSLSPPPDGRYQYQWDKSRKGFEIHAQPEGEKSKRTIEPESEEGGIRSLISWSSAGIHLLSETFPSGGGPDTCTFDRPVPLLLQPTSIGMTWEWDSTCKMRGAVRESSGTASVIGEEDFILGNTAIPAWKVEVKSLLVHSNDYSGYQVIGPTPQTLESREEREEVQWLEKDSGLLLVASVTARWTNPDGSRYATGFRKELIGRPG